MSESLLRCAGEYLRDTGVDVLQTRVVSCSVVQRGAGEPHEPKRYRWQGAYQGVEDARPYHHAHRKLRCILIETCMHTYVYTSTYFYIHTYLQRQVCMHARTHLRAHLHHSLSRARTHAFMNKHTHTLTCINLCTLSSKHNFNAQSRGNTRRARR